MCQEGLLCTWPALHSAQGNIVSCTKSQLCLWTVNGTLLATTTILITGSFKLLCCAVSEVQYWAPEYSHVDLHVHVDDLIYMFQ